MRKSILIFVLLITLSPFAFAILNGDFSLGEYSWNVYKTAESSVNFYPSPMPDPYVQILAHGSGGYAGIYQIETGFTSGEWKATFNIKYVSAGLGGLITIGWTDISGDFGSYYQEITSGGTYTVNCNNIAFPYVTVQADSTYIVNALVEVDDISTEQVGGDSNPPTYGLGIPPGAQNAYRVDGNTKAVVTWSPATDDSTPAYQMKYNVHTAETAGAVFTTPLKTDTFTGTLVGYVTGLDPTKTYYFGVRAEDQAGNEETNTVVLSSAPQTAVPNPVWNLYE